MDNQTRCAFAGILRQVASCLELPLGWNSYNAAPIDPETALYALRLLLVILPSTPMVTLVTPVRGGVQFEWSTVKGSMGICVHAPGSVEVYSETAEGVLEWQGDPEASVAGLEVIRLMVGRVVG